MTPLRKLSRPTLVLIAAVPIVLVPVLFFTNIGWLKSLPAAAALTIAVCTGLFVMVWSYAFANALQGRLDEVERASQGFAMHHGFTAGCIAVVVLLMIPPFSGWVIETSNAVALSLKGDVKVAPFLAYVAGFMTLVLAQTIGVFVMNIIWWGRKK